MQTIEPPDGHRASRPRAIAVRVLLVENHADTRLSVRAFLESLGYEVEEARNGAEARARSEQGGFDVLLSDINLPDGCGRELLVQLRQRGRCPRHAIAMSGLGGAGEEHRSRTAGFERHLVKPFDPSELQGALERAVPGAHDETPAVPCPPPSQGQNARLAQRMHDDLCQQLAAAAMWQGMLIRQLEGMAPPSRPPEQNIEEARQGSRLLDAALTEARALMRLLRGDGARS